MNNHFGLTDYRSELYVRVLRCWVIVKYLSHNRNLEKILTLQKAAFIDYLLNNHSLLQECLLKFGKNHQTGNFQPVLYRDNMEYGDAQSVQEFLKTTLILREAGYIEMERREVDIYLSPSILEIDLSTELTSQWIITLELIKPLLSKSISLLQKSILGE